MVEAGTRGAGLAILYALKDAFDIDIYEFIKIKKGSRR
jgi:hypothetical protein